MLKAIETRYKGYRFRSRLEARWAVFFDALGVGWEYEKEGFELISGRYLPDFWLPDVYDRSGQSGVWVEIKGQEPNQKELDLCEQLAIESGHSSNLFVGLPDPDDCNNGHQWTYHAPTDKEMAEWRCTPSPLPEAWQDFGMVFHHCFDCRLTKIEFSNDYYTCFRCKRQTCTWSDEKLYQAFNYAKSARFEYGETPRI